MEEALTRHAGKRPSATGCAGTTAAGKKQKTVQNKLPPSSPSRPLVRHDSKALQPELLQHTSGQWSYIKDPPEGEEETDVVVNHLVSEKLKCLHGKTCCLPDERDILGANPLHLAVLYSLSGDNISDSGKSKRSHQTTRALGWEEKEAHENIARKIWETEELHHLRTQGYDRSSYEGETCLHLAIGAKNGILLSCTCPNSQNVRAACTILHVCNWYCNISRPS